MSNSTSQQPSVTRQTLASDLQHLITLPPSTLTSLSTLHPASEPSSSASAALAMFSPSAATVADSQSLIRAYISDMRGDVLQRDSAQGEELGARIDALREEGEGLKAALDDVKV